MEPLIISNTKSTPAVSFDPVNHHLTVRGQTYPENAFQFFQPILQWLDDYLSCLDPDVQTNLELQLPYMNTSSAKCFMMLLERLEDAHQAGKNVQVNWYYDADNESELECAEEFREDLSLPFAILPKTE